ncbi:MAG: hypothetical protein CMJ64_20670 [Planctomycetaceae bacterium]|nr:hypothetical protein [Planctomycetaceae bacterium]
MSVALFACRHYRLVLGLVLLVQIALIVVVKLSLGRVEQLCWFCHISLGIAALGLLTRSGMLTSIALTNIVILHMLSILDLLCWKANGEFPFGLSSYVVSLRQWTRLATTHHLFLLPLLLIVFIRDGRYPRETWLISTTSFVWALLITRAVTSPSNNVNYAFFVPDSLTWSGLAALNASPGEFYPLGLSVVVSVTVFLPASVCLSWLAKSRELVNALA